MKLLQYTAKGNMRMAEIPQTAFPRWVPILTSILRSSRGDFLPPLPHRCLRHPADVHVQV